MTTRLNIEYRCHSDLYAPPLNKSMQSLPRSLFQDDDTVFRLSKYTHFLDVQGGKYGMLREVAVRTSLKREWLFHL